MRKRHILPIAATLCSIFCMAQPATFSSRSAALQALKQAEATWGNPLSPKHDEVKYVDILKAVCANEELSESDKLRPQLLLTDALKNQIGSQAADIEYVTADGSSHHLLDTTAPLLLIYFNDPECEACEAVKSRLDTCATLKNMVAEKRIEIIGIYTLDNEEAWKSAKFPSYMVNGWNSNQDIETNETYTLPTMPLFYLLDADKKVLLKAEASLNKVLHYLTSESTK